MKNNTISSIYEIEAALSSLPNHLAYEDFVRVGLALASELGAREAARLMFHHFPPTKEGETIQDYERKFREPHSVKIGTLFHIAKQYGYNPTTKVTSEHKKQPNQMQTISPTTKQTNGTFKKEVCSYVYVDENDNVLYERVRYIPKSFAYRRKVDGEYVYNMQGVKHVLYRLPDVIHSNLKNQMIFFVEGEKDVETLRALGLTATTTGDANAKWIEANADVLEPLHGANVVVLCDNDEVGRKYATAVCEALRGKTSKLKLVDLARHVPDFPEKADVTDWIEHHEGSKEKLLEIVNETPIYEALRKPTKDETRDDEMRDDEHQNSYIIRDGAFYYVSEKKETRISNFVARIVEEHRIVSDSEPKSVFVLEGEVEGRKLPRLKIDAKQFYRIKEWLASWDGKLMITPRYADYVCNAIIAHSNQTKHNIIAQTGFMRIDDQLVYCTHQNIISKTPTRNLTVELDSEIAKYHIAKPDETLLEQARQTSLALLNVADHHITIPLWTSMYMSVLKEFLQPNFALWLYGQTGSFKTTLATLFLNHFGNFTHNDLLTWNATSNSLERYLHTLKDVPAIIDDYAPMADNYAAQKVEQTIMRVIRDVGNGSGRARMKYDTSLATVYRPRAFVICTGELLPDGESILARLMIINVKREQVNMELLKSMNAKKHLLQACMHDFIMFVINNYDEVKKACDEIFQEYREELHSAERHARLTDAIANLMTALTITMQYFVDSRTISDKQAQTIMMNALQVMLANADQHVKEQRNENPVMLFFETLESLITANKCALVMRNGVGVLGGTETVGLIDNDNLYLNMKEAYRAVVKSCRDSNKRFPLKEASLVKMLDEQELIVLKEAGRTTTRIQENGVRYRVIAISRHKLEEMGVAIGGEISKMQIYRRGNDDENSDMF
ncbi:MAG: DUF927 domain-containing protein [Chloroherpetonaceae bacterium]